MSASSRALHSIEKEHMSPEWCVPPSESVSASVVVVVVLCVVVVFVGLVVAIVVSVVVLLLVLLYLAMTLHPVAELPRYLHPPSDCTNTLGQVTLLLCLFWLLYMFVFNSVSCVRGGSDFLFVSASIGFSNKIWRH